MNKHEIKNQATKKKLTEAFIELYSETSIEHITVKAITDKAGYNRGTFYLHYYDVYDIYEGIKKDLIEKMKFKINQFLAENNEIQFDQFFRIVFNFYNENEKYVVPLIRQDISFVNAIKSNIKPVIYKWFNIISEQDKLEVDFLVEYHLSAIVGMINLWSINRSKILIEQLLNIIFRVSTKGVMTVLNDKKELK